MTLPAFRVRSRLFLAAVPLVVVASAALLPAYTPAVPLVAAPNATDAACADVVVHLPTSVANQPERETNAQGSGAWGNPATILLHCGVEVPGPTTLPCVNINGVDWISDDSQLPIIRLTTYGREPAVEVVVDTKKASWTTAAVDLTEAVTFIPAKSACIGVNDVQIPSGDDDIGK